MQMQSAINAVVLDNQRRALQRSQAAAFASRLRPPTTATGPAADHPASAVASIPVAAALPSPPPSTPPAPTRPARPTLTAVEFQERIQAIVKHPLALGYEALALALCSDTSLSIEQALGALQASHQDDIEEVNGQAMLKRLVELHQGKTPQASAHRPIEAAYPSLVANATKDTAGPTETVANATTAPADATGAMTEAEGRAMLTKLVNEFNSAHKRRA